MSRTYLLYGECKGIYKDCLWMILIDWCGYEQIFKVNISDGVAYFYCEMGCSSGIAPEDTMRCFKEKLERNGAKYVFLRVWSMHQDDSLCNTGYIKDV